jgi:peptidoglycan/xylan/chitin deacetylase (PgdA/CDA1 family)
MTRPFQALSGRPAAGPAGTVPILMYHVLGTRSTPGFHRFTLHPDLFVAHLELLAGLGYRFLTVSRLAALRAAGHVCGRRDVVLTFDDGYADFHTYALPALARFNATATLYVTTGHIGRVADWTHGDHGTERRMLSWTQLAEVSAAGVEIGAHSHSHRELDLVRTDELPAEVTVPRAELADRLGVPVDSFAYPFGYHSPAVRAEVAAAGYRSACGVQDLMSRQDSDPLILPRRSVNADTDVAALRRLLTTPPTASSRCLAEVKRLAWQACRRSRPRHRLAAAAHAGGPP